MADLNEQDDEIIEQQPAAEVAEAPKADPLDDIINQALDDRDGGDEQTAEGRARDGKGRFAAKGTEAEAAPDDGTSAQPAVVPSTEPPKDAQPEISEGHFRGWSPEQKEAFQKLPPEAQKIALDVVQAKDRFYGEKLDRVTQYAEAAYPLVNVVKPHVDRIRQVTDDPSKYLAHILDVDYKLQYAPYAEKVQLLTQLAANIGVPIAPPQADPLSDPMSPTGEAYPVIHDLRNQLAEMQRQIASYKRQNDDYSQQRISSSIAEFAAQKNADGSPKYPHFEMVRGAMGQLMDSGKARTLEEAYQLSAKPIQEHIAGQLAASQKAAEAAQRAAVEKAKRNAPIRTSGIAPGGKTSSKGLDAVLSNVLDQAGFQ